MFAPVVRAELRKIDGVSMPTTNAENEEPRPPAPAITDEESPQNETVSAAI
jgi:hypothetical protein